VTFKIYSITGQLVKTVLSGLRQPQGAYEVSIDMRDAASGMYVYVMQTETQRMARRMLLLK
jgi:hypothetical protein